MTSVTRIDFDEIDSTQLEVRRRLEPSPAQPPFLVCARKQTAGRGRMGRSWSGAPGATLMCSIWCPTPGAPTDTVALTPLAAGVGVIEWLDQWAPGLMLKWPNDILAPTGGKIAGILCEGIWQNQELAGTIVGIGINVRRPPDAESIEANGRPVSALADLCNPDWHALNHDLTKLADTVCQRIEQLLQGNTSKLIDTVNQRLARTARAVRLMRFESENTLGYIEGVSARGHLLFRHVEDGRIEEIASGELILPDQGIEGYPQKGTARASDG